MHKTWFKRKKYGYGWTPATKEGWSIIGIYLGILVLDVFRISSFALSDIEFLINFIPDLFFLTLALLIITIFTGEKPHWQWGDKQNSLDKKR